MRELAVRGAQDLETLGVADDRLRGVRLVGTNEVHLDPLLDGRHAGADTSGGLEPDPLDELRIALALVLAPVENGLRCCSAERNSPFSPDRTRRMGQPRLRSTRAPPTPRPPTRRDSPIRRPHHYRPLALRRTSSCSRCRARPTGAVPDHRKRKGAEPLDSFPKALRSSHDSTSSRMVVPLLDNLMACA